MRARGGRKSRAWLNLPLLHQSLPDNSEKLGEVHPGGDTGAFQAEEKTRKETVVMEALGRLLTHPIMNAIAIGVGVLGIILAYTFYLNGRRLKESCWSIRSTKLIPMGIGE